MKTIPFFILGLLAVQFCAVPLARGLIYNALLGAEGGRFYAVENTGNLRFYWFDENAQTFINGGGPIIGTGWHQYSKVFYGSTGVVYAVRTDGRLLYFRDVNRDGTGQVSTNGFEIGNGWSGFRWLMGDTNGVIYAINN